MPSGRRARRWRIAWLGAAMPLLAAVATATACSFRRAAQSYDWVEHTYAVIDGLQEYRAAIRSAESAARGYRLSPVPALREELARLGPKTIDELDRLQALLSDNPTQAQRVSRLRGLNEERLRLVRDLAHGRGGLAAMLSAGTASTMRASRRSRPRCWMRNGNCWPGAGRTVPCSRNAWPPSSQAVRCSRCCCSGWRSKACAARCAAAGASPLGLLHVSGDAATDRVQAQALLTNVAEQLGLALVNLQLRDKLRAQSLRDPLTGLHNRRYLDEALPREVTRCLRRGLPLAVLMLDVDHFKAFNDIHGHAAGDALLATLAQVLQDKVRGEDLVCRYGGEEFTIVLTETGRDEALQRAEQIRAAVAQVTVQHLRQTLGPCTASIGVAMLPGQGETPEALLHVADHALYRAKGEGRNRVVAA